MTAALFFSPQRVPAIIADTVVTICGPDLQPLQRRLARKIFFLGNTIAISVSGEEERIQSFIEAAQLALGHMLTLERPMRFLGDLLNNVYPGLEGIGCHVRKQGEEWSYNLTTFRGVEEFQWLGPCGAVGSGYNKILNYAREADNLINKFTIVRGHPYEIIRHTAGYINNARMLDEVLKGVSDTDWGTFLEHVYFDLAAERWTLPEPSLHLFYAGEVLKEREVRVRPLLPLVAYAPQDHQLLILAPQGEDVVFRPVLLKNLFPDFKIPTLKDALNLWSFWRPFSVTVSLWVPERRQTAIRTLWASEIEKVIFEISDRGAKFGLEEELAAETFSSCLKRMGLTYSPEGSISRMLDLSPRQL